MASTCHSALILCPKSANGGNRQLLGLSIGERLLLALSFAGVNRVAFVGDGERPKCSRADIKIVETSELDTDSQHIVMGVNTVFDRALLSEEVLPERVLPIRTRPSHNSAKEQLTPDMATDSQSIRNRTPAKPSEHFYSRSESRWTAWFLAI